LIFCCALLALLPARAAAEDDPAVLLKQAEAHYEQLEYEKALQELIKVQAAEGATPIQKARAYLYMGVCFTALGKASDAVAAFAEVLKRRPNFRMPAGVSPSIRAMFKAALEKLGLPETPQEGGQPGGGSSGPAEPPSAGGQGVDLDAQAPRRLRAGKSVEVSVEIDDPDKKVAELVIRWRRRKGPDYSTIQLSHKPGAKQTQGVIPAAVVGDEPGKLTFFVEARDKSGRRLATAGTPDDPYEVTLQKPTHDKEKGGGKGWWWLAIGGGVAAVAGGVIAAVLLTRDSSGGPSDTAALTVIVQ
jgi:hypothetical protein